MRPMNRQSPPSFHAGLLLLAALILGLAGCTTTPFQDQYFTGSTLATPTDTGPYLIRPGDTVLLEVFQEPYMTTRQKVLEDGTIAVGLVGRVAIAGETIPGAADKIAARLNERHLVNPQVSLTMENYAARRFVVWGQVRNPGSFTIPAEESITLPEAIAMAGGNSEIGNLRSVTITRRVSGGGTRKVKMNALSTQAESFVIQEGDVIRVSETIF